MTYTQRKNVFKKEKLKIIKSQAIKEKMNNVTQRRVSKTKEHNKRL